MAWLLAVPAVSTHVRLSLEANQWKHPAETRVAPSIS